MERMKTNLPVDESCNCCWGPCPKRVDDPWEGRLDGYCTDCATARCDAYPGECGKRRQSRRLIPSATPESEES